MNLQFSYPWLLFKIYKIQVQADVAILTQNIFRNLLLGEKGGFFLLPIVFQEELLKLMFRG
jgi:hypothetical protein